jgi:phage repressor protein C with HTH and peptisase S24 domain
MQSDKSLVPCKYAKMDNDQSAARAAVLYAMETAGLTATELAKKARLAPSTLTRFLKATENGANVSIKHSLSSRTLRAIEEAAGIVESNRFSVSSQARAEAPSIKSQKEVTFAGESYASVAVYEAAVSAGPGSLNADHATPLAYNLFRRDWLRSVTRVAVEHLAILKVHGDSMVPTLLSGDDVLVDLSVKHVGRDGLYVLAADHEVQVKRVSRSPLDKSLSISSDNPAAQSWVGVSDENVFILGRVIWLGRTI